MWIISYWFSSGCLTPRTSFIMKTWCERDWTSCSESTGMFSQFCGLCKSSAVSITRKHWHDTRDSRVSICIKSNHVPHNNGFLDVHKPVFYWRHAPRWRWDLLCRSLSRRGRKKPARNNSTAGLNNYTKGSTQGLGRKK